MKQIQLGFIENGTGKHQSNTVWSIHGLCPCISTLIDGGTQQIKVLVVEDRAKILGNVYGDNFGCSFAGNVYDKDYLAPTLMNMQGGGRQPLIVTASESKSDRGGYQRTEIICSLALNASERFSLFNTELFKCIKANNDLGILEEIWKRNST